MATWTKHRNEEAEKKFQAWRLDVQNILVASKTGVDTTRLEADLEENVGKCPLEEMGFKEWGEFLYAIRDIFHVHHFYHEDPTNPRTRLFLFINDASMSSANKDVLAIAKLVREQEKTKTKRRMDGTTNAPTKYQVAKCDAFHLLKKKSTAAYRESLPPSRGRGGYRSRGGSRGGGRSSSTSTPYSRSSSYSRPGLGFVPTRGGFTGGSSSYNSRPRPLMPTSPQRAPRVLHFLPAGFEDDGGDDFDDDAFDYCSGVTSRPKNRADELPTVPSRPTRSVDVVDNRRINQIPTFATNRSVDKPAQSANSASASRPRFTFPGVVKSTPEPVLSTPTPKPEPVWSPPIAREVVNKINPVNTPPRPNSVDRHELMKPVTTTPLPSMAPNRFGPPIPMKPYTPPNSVANIDGGVRVKIEDLHVVPEEGPLGRGRGRPIYRDGFRRPIPNYYEGFTRGNHLSDSDSALDELSTAPTRKVDVVDSPSSQFRRAITAAATSVRPKATLPEAKKSNPVPLLPTPFPAPLLPTPFPAPLLPTPSPVPKPEPVMNGPTSRVSGEVVTMLMNLVIDPPPKPVVRRGPPIPMKPYTPPTSVNIPSASAHIDRVLRVSVEENYVERPVMLARGPLGRGRPLNCNGYRRIPDYEGNYYGQIDLSDRVGKNIRDTPVEQVRRLQFHELKDDRV